jgi:hypothetical protein
VPRAEIRLARSDRGVPQGQITAGFLLKNSDFERRENSGLTCAAPPAYHSRPLRRAAKNVAIDCFLPTGCAT